MYLARRDGAFDEDDLVYCQLLSDMAGSAIENARLYGELQSTVTQYRSLIERLPAVTYLDDLETGETRVHQPADHRAVRNHPRRVEGEPRRLAAAPSIQTTASGPAAAFAEAMEMGEPFHAEYRVLSPDAVVRWVVDRTVVLPRVDGQPALTQGMIFDITDRKRAEQELEPSRQPRPAHGAPEPRPVPSRARRGDPSRPATTARAVAVMYVDLDDFKLVNDGFGHEVGDELLVAVAERLRRATRATDLVGRDGGDEFLVLMPNLPAAPRGRNARAPSWRPPACAASLRRPVSAGSVELDVSASVGVSLFPFDAADTQTLLKHADAAMYDAKAAGRDACRFYEPGARDSEERLALTARLRQAIKHGELALHYQPIVELASGRMVGRRGAGALERRRAGRDRPDEFIPLAERTGLIRPLSE